MYEVTSILDALYAEADAYENYTYRQAYKDAIEDVEDAIKSLPSDVLAESSEVVRCKDCRHRVHDEERGLYYCEMYYGQGDVSDKNFCQWGERREK